MLDALRSQNDIDTAPDDLVGPVQCRTGRKLNDVDEVALVLLRDETGRRLCQLDAGNADQSSIDHEHDDRSADESPRQVPVAEREPTEAPIEAIESLV